MKILHIYREKNLGVVGGVENHVQYVAIEQLKLGLSPVVLTFSLGAKNFKTIEIRNEIVWYNLTVKEGIFLKWLLKCFDIISKTGFLSATLERIFQNFILKQKLTTIDEIKPNIIHQHDYISSIRLSKKLSKKYKIIFTNHYGEYLLLKKNRLTNYIQHYFLNHFEAIIASSKELLPEMKNCYQISNGFDTNIFHEISSEEKHQSKIKLNIDGKITFLCARRWAPTKGIIYLAKALNLLDEKVQKKIVILFAGNDSEDFYKYKAIVQSELDKCSNIDIRYFGNIKHKKLAELINSSDVGIIPSIMEGISLFSIELVSCGIPVLGTDVGGIPEIVKNNVTGWIVPPKSPSSLAKQMTYIVQNWPNSSLKINTEEIRKAHSWTSITKEIVNIYETKK